jgi:Tfp pilus assembly protein PilF
VKRAPEPPLVRLTTLGQVWLLAFGCTLVVSSELGLTQETGAVIGNVLNENGKSVAAAHVVVRSLSGNGDEVELKTESDGTYAHGNIKAGLYTVMANADGLSGDMFRVRIRAGQTVEINFSLIPGGRDAAWIAELGVIESASRAFTAGLTATRAADHITAVRLFTRATEQTPDCAACHYNLAVSYMMLQRFMHAEVAFQRVLELIPDYSAAYYGLASIYTQQGRTTDAANARDEATRLARARLKKQRRQFKVVLVRGIAHLKSGRLAAAVKDFEDLLNQDHSFAATHYWLAVSLKRSNQSERAIKEFRRYLQLASDGEYVDHARQALSSLGR